MRYKDLGQYFTVGCISGPLSNLIGLHEFFDGMMSIRNEPSRFFDIATSLLKNIEKRAKLAHDNSFGAIAIADDIAGNKGPLFSFN